MTDADYAALEALVWDELTESNFIATVKLAREMSNGAWGLPDAKAFVERIQRQKFGAN